MALLVCSSALRLENRVNASSAPFANIEFLELALPDDDENDDVNDGTDNLDKDDRLDKVEKCCAMEEQL
jgi:hypothetical protein